MGDDKSVSPRNMQVGVRIQSPTHLMEPPQDWRQQLPSGSTPAPHIQELPVPASPPFWHAPGSTEGPAVACTVDAENAMKKPLSSLAAYIRTIESQQQKQGSQSAPEAVSLASAHVPVQLENMECYTKRSSTECYARPPPMELYPMAPPTELYPIPSPEVYAKPSPTEWCAMPQPTECYAMPQPDRPASMQEVRMHANA